MINLGLNFCQRLENGVVVEAWEFVADDRGNYIKHGRNVYYDGQGGVVEEGYFENGVQIGMWTSWHRPGVKAQEGEYSNGKEHGLWRYWRSDGSLEAEGTWENGKVHGLWKEYSPTGEIALGEFRNGKPWTGRCKVERSIYEYRNGRRID